MPKVPSKFELRKIARNRFLAGRNAERTFQRQLVAVSKQVGALVKGFAPNGVVTDLPALREALRKYARVLEPWAEVVTKNMHLNVTKRDTNSWGLLGQEVGRSLRKEIASAPTGQALRSAMAEQVALITSLPTEAAERVHQLTLEAISQTAGRASEIQKEIMKSGHVTASRAKLIARTETSRTASLLLEARSKYVGSTHYIWHTSGDSDVRAEHRKLNNKVFEWDKPPIAGTNGMRYNPGAGPNCRCWAEPILPENIS